MVSISKSTSAKLMDAADRGDLREVKRLVEKKHADVNAKDNDGMTAGMVATGIAGAYNTNTIPNLMELVVGIFLYSFMV